MTTDIDNQDNKRSTEQETLETSERRSCIICECELPDGDNIDNLNDDEVLCGECVARNRGKSASENDDNNEPPPSPTPTDCRKGSLISHITSSSPKRKPSSYRYYYEPGGSWPR